jgi:hypothetical protein
MAKAIQMSLSGLINVLEKDQEPGRRLMEAIIENSDVNPGWMLTGKGGSYLSSALPVAHRALPGRPQDHRDLLTDEKVEALGDLYSASRYWLKVQPSEPIMRDKSQQIKSWDLLLMETDKAKLPQEDKLWETLCVIRVPDVDPPEYKLATVSYRPESNDDGQARLEADTFDLGPEVITQIVVEESPGGELRAFKRPARPVKTEGRLKPRKSGDMRLLDMDCPLIIGDSAIVAVCLLVVRLPGTGSLASRVT